MNSTIESHYFDGFEYPVTELSKYIRAGDIFTIMLRNNDIIHYTIKEADTFEKWLLSNQITNITPEKGSGKNKEH